MATVFIYITTANEAEAKKISHYLLKKRLVACANIFPMQSIYWWEGRIQEGSEAVLLAKTEEKYVARVEKEVVQLHSYTVPCITAIPVVPNSSYGAWLQRQLLPSPEKHRKAKRKEGGKQAEGE